MIKNSAIEINNFPGGPKGFELISRFCYSNGEIEINSSNAPILHCCAVFLSIGNLLEKTSHFFSGLFDCSWNDLISSLKSCEPFFPYADSCGILEKLVSAVSAKITQNSLISSPSESISSPESASRFRFSVSSKDSIKKSKSSQEWWFDGLTVLSPKIIEKIIKKLGDFGVNNKSLVITKFLLHYLKFKLRTVNSRSEYSGLAVTTVNGVILAKTEFSCRKLFWILRLVSEFHLSRKCKSELERLIGLMLDQATLDDLLVSGNDCVYDVNLVLRLIRAFVNGDNVLMTQQKMKKLGRLIDKYLTEISPDQKLEISKFLAVAESLPDSARDCFDDVYRALDIYLESHPALSFEERSMLCRCLNYSKLTLRACKDLAKNPRIPPTVAVQALLSQQSKVPQEHEFECEISSPVKNNSKIILCKNGLEVEEKGSSVEELEMNLERMQWRVVELEKICREMKGQMSKMARGNFVISASQGRTLPKLC